MQDNTTGVISASSTEALDGHVLEQAAFHTQIPIYLCCHVAKKNLQSYLQINENNLKYKNMRLKSKIAAKKTYQ